MFNFDYIHCQLFKRDKRWLNRNMTNNLEFPPPEEQASMPPPPTPALHNSSQGYRYPPLRLRVTPITLLLRLQVHIKVHTTVNQWPVGPVQPIHGHKPLPQPLQHPETLRLKTLRLKTLLCCLSNIQQPCSSKGIEDIESSHKPSKIHLRSVLVYE